MTHDEPDGGDRIERSEDTGEPHAIHDGDVSSLEAELQRRNEPYARATVVRREPPASANVGDRAIVTADGELHGWVGGAACAQSIVSSGGVEAIESETPQLVGIAPDPDTVDRPGLEAHRMTCHSDGVLEVFVEPVTPTTELVIVGDSPVAQSLARLAAELSIDRTIVAQDEETLDFPADTDVVTAIDPETIADAVAPAPIVVVASMGKYDARGIAAGVLAAAPYVGLIASDDRAETEIERAAGLLDLDPETVAETVTNPAGVDIPAYTPAEIAASLLAAVVEVRSRGTSDTGAVEAVATGGGEQDAAKGASDSTDGPEATTDPVCGMTVAPAEAAATVEHDGETYHFCCHGCADSFEADPESHLEADPEVHQ